MSSSDAGITGTLTSSVTVETLFWKDVLRFLRNGRLSGDFIVVGELIPLCCSFSRVSDTEMISRGNMRKGLYIYCILLICVSSFLVKFALPWWLLRKDKRAYQIKQDIFECVEIKENNKIVKQI